MDICRKLFANVENWTEAKPRGTKPCTKSRMQKRTLRMKNIAFVGGRHLLKPYQEEYLKNIRRISEEYQKNIVGDGARREFEISWMRSRSQGLL